MGGEDAAVQGEAADPHPECLAGGYVCNYNCSPECIRLYAASTGFLSEEGKKRYHDLTVAAQGETLSESGAALPPGISLHPLVPEETRQEIAGHVEDMIHARAPLSEHWPPYTVSPISAAVNLAKIKGEIKARTVERDLCGAKLVSGEPIDIAESLIDVAQMPAGKEMDSLIAERVMGWAKHPHVDSPTYWWEGPMKSYLIDNLPPFSSDIADAWQVFGEMESGLFSSRKRFHQALNEQADIQAECLVGHHVAWPDVLTVLRYVMPVAICRAALLSLRPGGKHVNIRIEIEGMKRGDV